MILVPVLLQLALFIFLIGLVILLWNLHPTVAAVCTAFTGLLILFFLVINALPIYRPDCCYRSPQALLIYSIIGAFHSQIQGLLQQWIQLCTSHRFKDTAFSHSDALWSSLLRCGAVVSQSLPNYPGWKTKERHDLREHSVALNVETAVTAYRTTLDPACLDCMHVALSSEPGAPLAHCITKLDVNLADGTVAAPTSLKPNILRRLSRMLLTALRQMLTIEAKNREDSWEPSVQRLLSLYIGVTSILNIPPTELALRTIFHISMDASSTENLYAALTYLAAAVDDRASVQHPITLTLLHAAEQWVDKHVPQPQGAEGPRSIVAAPEVSMVAFLIIAQCMDRVVRHRIEAPEEHALDVFLQHCNGARESLSRIPAFLPTTGMLCGARDEAENKRLCNQLSFGLKLLLDALVKLLQSVSHLPLADQPGVLLIDLTVVESLMSVWTTARMVLGRPEVNLIAPEQPQGTVERLERLQGDVDALFPQNYGPMM
ncbi:hypothetical protein C8Q73DRAFT_655916 [Cubamyces lactineus]|nr:hypothetical protein C8Q73DRAFT_655916 [Cubamyces lactineus]